uniref:Uncharacterized protein n=1 Tax=Oryzias latipes TaxID=8090 RepID=A0A3P9LQF5_ORYLA
MHFQLKESEKKNFCNYTCSLMLSKRDQTSHPDRSRLDMTSLQQVAQFVPRVFNHQDCDGGQCDGLQKSTIN